MNVLKHVEEIRFWRGTDRDGRKGWFCMLDAAPFKPGIHVKGFGCCRPIAFARAKREFRRAWRKAGLS